MRKKCAGGLGHVAVAPERAAEPISEIRTGTSLDLSGGIHTHADTTDQGIVKGDGEEVRLGRSLAELCMNEAPGIIERIGPRRRAEPADDLPIGEQVEKSLRIVGA